MNCNEKNNHYCFGDTFFTRKDFKIIFIESTVLLLLSFRCVTPLYVLNFIQQCETYNLQLETCDL